MKYKRKYVRVNADHMSNGQVIPLILYWEVEGILRAFPIDVLDERPAHSRKVGGQGILYLVMVAGKERSLFYDKFEHAFFVEEKVKPDIDSGMVY